QLHELPAPARLLDHAVARDRSRGLLRAPAPAAGGVPPRAPRRLAGPVLLPARHRGLHPVHVGLVLHRLPRATPRRRGLQLLHRVRRRRPRVPALRAPRRRPDLMVDIVEPRVEEYMRSLLERYDEPVLLEMERVAAERNFPIVNRIVGVTLEALARSIGAKRVFELGSGYGYSAYWFARAVGPSGEVYLTDGDPENEK